MSFDMLKIILAALKCNLSMDFDTSELQYETHKTRPYFSEGKITLKKNSRKMFLHRILEHFNNSNVLTKLFFTEVAN